MTILYTDYKNIALIYKCQQFPLNSAHRLSASVLVTDKTYNDKQQLEKVNKNYSHPNKVKCHLRTICSSPCGHGTPLLINWLLINDIPQLPTEKLEEYSVWINYAPPSLRVHFWEGHGWALFRCPPLLLSFFQKCPLPTWGFPVPLVPNHFRN